MIDSPMYSFHDELRLGLRQGSQPSFLDPASISDADPHKLAVLPYPAQYTWEFTAKDGSEFTIRPIRPDDEPMVVEFHRNLSERSVYYRYFSPLTLRVRTSHERLIGNCFIDYEREMALVAERVDADGKPMIAGIARMIREDNGITAEVAFIVVDRFQRKGLGGYLMDRTIEIARKEGLSSLQGVLLFENLEMRKLFESRGFKFGEPEYGVWSAKLELNQRGSGEAAALFAMR